jgi:HEAT repeat protein
VLKSLEDIGTASAAALPSLAKALDDLDPRIRERTARLIGRFGARASAYAPALQKLTTDPDPKVRREASAAVLAVEDE